MTSNTYPCVTLSKLFHVYNVHLSSKTNLPSSVCPPNSENAKGRLPGLTAWYEGINTPHLFVLGTAGHSRDYRSSAGSFIHGFRYTGDIWKKVLAHLGLHGVTHMSTTGNQTHWTCTIGNFTQIKVIFNLYGFSGTARAVHRVLEQRYHGNPWHSTKLLTTQLLSWTLKRINEASGLYQMVGVLGDVIVLRGYVYVIFVITSNGLLLCSSWDLPTVIGWVQVIHLYLPVRLHVLLSCCPQLLLVNPARC